MVAAHAPKREGRHHGRPAQNIVYASFLLAPHIQSGADHGIGQVARVAGFDPQDQPGPWVRLGLQVLGNPLLGRLSARQKADKAARSYSLTSLILIP